MLRSCLVLACLLFAPLARATVFDAADILPQNSGAIGGFGEILLSDPTSEGLEARGRYGLSDDWNVGADIGTGDKNKNFRLGGLAVYNIFPDWKGQLGFSAIGTATYIVHPAHNELQLGLGPMLHKRLTGWNALPTTIYLALPFYFSGEGGSYYTGSQLVGGADFDVADKGRFYLTGELGVKFGHADSYVLFGFGLRLGDLQFTSSSENGNSSSHDKKNVKSTKEYTDEDFQKKIY